MRLHFSVISSLAGLALLAGCSRETPQLTEEAAEPAPVSLPTIVLEGGPRRKPGDVVKGRLVGLDKGKYKLAWKDGAGTLWSREFEGPGDRDFSFALSLPRFAVNTLVLTPVDVDLGKRELLRGFHIDLPTVGRKGYLRVLDPGDGQSSGLAEFPAEAVLWSLDGGSAACDGRPLLLDLAWKLPEPGVGSWPGAWGPTEDEVRAAAALSLGSWPPPTDAFERAGGGAVGPSPRRRGFGPAGGSTTLTGRRGPVGSTTLTGRRGDALHDSSLRFLRSAGAVGRRRPEYVSARESQASLCFHLPETK